jgi:hypothetical protein
LTRTFLICPSFQPKTQTATDADPNSSLHFTKLFFFFFLPFALSFLLFSALLTMFDALLSAVYTRRIVHFVWYVHLSLSIELTLFNSFCYFITMIHETSNKLSHVKLVLVLITQLYFHIISSGVYGDVQRVKILYNKKDNALVQMANAGQALLVSNHLGYRRYAGKGMRITFSKYNTVQMPKEGQPDAGLTKDYTNSPLHRFKKPGSKNFQNIFSPSTTLHLSNIPPSCNEEQLRTAFETQANAQVVQFKFFIRDQKMALIQLPSVEDAMFALVVSFAFCFFNH